MGTLKINKVIITVGDNDGEESNIKRSCHDKISIFKFSGSYAHCVVTIVLTLSSHFDYRRLLFSFSRVFQKI